MKSLAVIAIVLLTFSGGLSWIVSIFNPSYRKRRRDSRASLASKAWGHFALLSGIVLLVAAGLDYIGVITIK